MQPKHQLIARFSLLDFFGYMYVHLGVVACACGGQTRTTAFFLPTLLCDTESLTEPGARRFSWAGRPVSLGICLSPPATAQGFRHVLPHHAGDLSAGPQACTSTSPLCHLPSPSSFLNVIHPYSMSVLLLLRSRCEQVNS